MSDRARHQDKPYSEYTDEELVAEYDKSVLAQTNWQVGITQMVMEVRDLLKLVLQELRKNG
jgi:hypothetical protein